MSAGWVLLIGGIVLGAGLAAVVSWMRRRAAKGAQAEMEEALKGAFAQLSLEALSKNTDEFLKLAGEKFRGAMERSDQAIETKKQLIDQTLDEMRRELAGVQGLVRAFEKDRENKFGELSESLKSAAEQTAKLQQAADRLNNVLSDTKQRGHLGEKMTEDILRLVGFVESVNFSRQEVQGEGRPDYTFFLPRDLKINMDVKFPLNSYKKFLEAHSAVESDTYKKQFLTDTRLRIKEVTSKNYIDPEHGTVNYALLFIPSEQAFAFIQEQDPAAFEEALKNRVICCSPLTLYAVLVTIRQAIDIFVIGQRTQSILECLGAFNKNWDKFVASFDDLGKRIDGVKKEYDNLTTTRRNVLERSLRKIDDMREAEAPGGASREASGEAPGGASREAPGGASGEAPGEAQAEAQAGAQGLEEQGDAD